jgi:Right handed beta helix region
VTAVSTIVFACALSLLAVALTSGSPSPRADSAPRGRVIVHVAEQGCSDERPVREARRARTPWCSLTRAATGAPRGAVVEVAAGRYPALSLSGGGRRDLTFRPAGDGRPELAGLHLGEVTGLRLQGFRVTGTVELFTVDGVTLAGNDFAGTGIHMKTSRRVRIVGNRVHGLRGETRGILAQGSSAPAGRDNEDIVVRANRFDRIEHDAIAFYNGYRRVLVEGNRISRVIQPSNFAKHSDAMQFMGGDRLTLVRNVIRDSSQGILLKDGGPSTGLVVRGNLLHDITGAGLQLFDAPGARVVANTVWATRHGSFLRDDPGVPEGTSVSLQRNVLDRLTVEAEGMILAAAGNVFGAGATVGSPAYSGQPNFADPNGGDFRIDRTDPGAGIRAGGTPPGTRLRG